MTPCKIVLRSYNAAGRPAPSTLVFCQTCMSTVVRYVSGTDPDMPVLEVDTVDLLEKMQEHMRFAALKAGALERAAARR